MRLLGAGTLALVEIIKKKKKKPHSVDCLEMMAARRAVILLKRLDYKVVSLREILKL